MKTTLVTLRLTEGELAWVDQYANNYASRSEYLRYLIHSEHRKRSHTPVNSADYQTEWRNGRPKTTTTTTKV